LSERGRRNTTSKTRRATTYTKRSITPPPSRTSKVREPTWPAPRAHPSSRRRCLRLSEPRLGSPQGNGGPLIVFRDPDNIQLELWAFGWDLVTTNVDCGQA